MPLPFLLIPIAAAATGISTGTLVASITSAATGGIIIGGVVAHAVSKKTPIYPKVSETIKVQLDETKEAIQSLPPQLTKVAEAVEKANNVTGKAVNNLEEVIIELKETGIELTKGTSVAKEARAHLDTTSHELKGIKEELEAQIKKYEELFDLLKRKEDQIKSFQDEISSLKKTLDGQVIVSTQLEGRLKTLLNEKTELLEIIARQQKKIDILEPQNKQLAEQMRFFKQVALKSQRVEDTNQPSIAAFN